MIFVILSRFAPFISITLILFVGATLLKSTVQFTRPVFLCGPNQGMACVTAVSATSADLIQQQQQQQQQQQLKPVHFSE